MSRIARCAAVLFVGLCATAAPGQTLAERLAQAREHEQAGRIDAAAAARQEAIDALATDEERIAQLQELAALFVRAGMPHREAEALEELLPLLAAHDPRHGPTVDRLVGLYCREDRRPSAALAVLESVVRDLEPGRGDLRAWFQLAWIAHQMGDVERARPLYRRLLRSARSDSPLRLEILKGLEYCEPQSPWDAGLYRNLEASVLLGQVKARLSEREWEQADDQIQSLLERYRDAVQDASDALGTGPQQLVTAMVEALSPAAKRAYAEAIDQRIQDLLVQPRSEDLEHFALLHPWLEEPELAAAVGDALLAEERFSRAAAWYRRATNAADPAQRPQYLARSAYAAIRAGEPLPPGIDPDAAAIVAGETLPLGEALRRWQAEFGTPSARPPEPVPLSRMQESSLRLLQAPLALRKWEAGWKAERLDDTPTMTRAFLPYVLAGNHEQVFVNTSELLYAVDPVNEKLLWARGPSERFVAELVPPQLRQLQLDNTPKRFFTALSADTVFFRLNWASRSTQAPRSAILAADRRTGVLRWSTEGEARLEGMRFVSDPAYADGTIVAAAWQPTEIPVFHLVGLDAVTGQLQWTTQLYSGTMFPALRARKLVDTPLGAAPPAIAGGRAYFVADTGIMACVDVFSGQVVWLQGYPRTHEYGPDAWACEYFLNRPYGPPLVRDGLVLAAPRDAQGVLFFDAATGALLRTYRHMDFRCLIGADERQIYIEQGGAILALDPADASVRWRTRLPTSLICGSPALSARGLVCGTKDGLFVLAPDSGAIVDHRPPFSWEACGNPFDLGDRLLALSPAGLYVFAEEVRGGREWRPPGSPLPGELALELPAPRGLVRWALPAPDRGDFFLNARAPNLAVLRTWEAYELRTLDPLPSLRWIYTGRSWPRSIEFDEQTLALDFSGGELTAVDIASGTERWTAQDQTMGTADRPSGVVVDGERLVWFVPRRLRVLDARTGSETWVRDFPEGPLAGVCLHGRDVGVFVAVPAQPVALLLDGRNGDELRRIPLGPANPEGRTASVRCAGGDDRHTPEALPFALVNGQTVVAVDFAAGTTRSAANPTGQNLTGIVRSGDVLGLLNGNRVVGALAESSLAPLKPHEATLWAAAGGVQYYTAGPRIAAQNLATGTPLWQTRAFTWETTQLTVSGEYLLAAQYRQEGEQQRTRVVAIDRASGDVADEAPGLARIFHKLGQQGGALYASDLGYFYRFTAPRAQGPAVLQTKQQPIDADAIAALRIARDSETDTLPAPAAAARTPEIDGRLDEWQATDWAALSDLDAWRPDSVLWSPDRLRRPSGPDDASATYAVAQDASFVYLAVRVRDDVHEALPDRPLERGDAIQVTWVAAGEPVVPPLALCGALVHQVPCLELGPGYAPRALLPGRATWPAWLASAVAQGAAPWLRRRLESALEWPDVRFMARRDEAAGITAYELAVPAQRLPAARGEDGKLLWNLLVHDADGAGREGALETGTASCQLERSIGFTRWPTYGS